MVPAEVLKRLDLLQAVTEELAVKNALLPRRPDTIALAQNPEAVVKWVRPLYHQGNVGSIADVVFAEKGFRGTRPLHVMTVVDRILYRALVNLIAYSLPEFLRQRPAATSFRQAPLSADGVRYIAKTDVTAFYEYIDHELLIEELLAQTGEEPSIGCVAELLFRIMGRRVGIPQVHSPSDILGDTYIDPVRRRLIRAGVEAFRYSDDFRISTSTLGQARSAIEMCASEVRRLGLVLNERKTFTYTTRSYAISLESFREAERRLFEDEQHGIEDLFLLDGDLYGDTVISESDMAESLVLGAQPVESDLDEVETLESETDSDVADVQERQADAARRAWNLWLEEEESEDAQSRVDAAITQSLLSRALPALGRAGDTLPLRGLGTLFRYEPSLAPQAAEYIANYAASGPRTRKNAQSALDSLISEDILSDWHRIWVVEAAGRVRASDHRARPHLDWLVASVETGPAGLAATSAAALGRLKYGDPGILANAIDRVGPAWRQLVLWGLAGLNVDSARAAADNQSDRLVLQAIESIS